VENWWFDAPAAPAEVSCWLYFEARVVAAAARGGAPRRAAAAAAAAARASLQCGGLITRSGLLAVGTLRPPYAGDADVTAAVEEEYDRALVGGWRDAAPGAHAPRLRAALEKGPLALAVGGLSMGGFRDPFGEVVATA
jgi:hypothetical protein